MAMLFAVGLAALARWLVDGEPWALTPAAVFFAAALLTKNEAAVFVGAAFVAAALVVVRRRRRLRELALAAAAVVVAIAPWRLFLAVNDFQDIPAGAGGIFDVATLAATVERAAPAARELWAQTSQWSSLALLLAVGVAASAAVRRFTLAAFGLIWFALSFAGLVLVYWTSPVDLEEYLLFSADRTVAALAIGSGVVAAVLAGEAWRLALKPS